MSKDINKPNSCKVCNSPTASCHYSVACCFGCRSFFRRCIINKKAYKCNRLNTCKIEDLRNCKNCRLRRCHEVGLNPAWIRTEKNIENRSDNSFNAHQLYIKVRYCLYF